MAARNGGQGYGQVCVNKESAEKKVSQAALTLIYLTLAKLEL